MHEASTFFKKNFLAISLQVVAFLVFILNLWITTKLVPISERFIRVESKVEAIEEKMESSDAVVMQDVEEIKRYLLRLDDKLDHIIQQK